MVTIGLFAMSVAYLYAGASGKGLELAVMQTVLAGLFMVWSLVLVAWKRQNPLLMPQWILFAPITVLGVVGCL
jgi:preprotein translocase subunit SecG